MPLPQRLPAAVDQLPAGQLPAQLNRRRRCLSPPRPGANSTSVVPDIAHATQHDIPECIMRSGDREDPFVRANPSIGDIIEPTF